MTCRALVYRMDQICIKLNITCHFVPRQRFWDAIGKHSASFQIMCDNNDSHFASSRGFSGVAAMREAWASRSLFISHGLVAFGNRLWQFATPLLLVAIFPSSLLAVAAFQLCMYISEVFALPKIGSWVDSAPRERAVLVGTFGQCPLVAASAQCSPTEMAATTAISKHRNQSSYYC